MPSVHTRSALRLAVGLSLPVFAICAAPSLAHAHQGWGGPVGPPHVRHAGPLGAAIAGAAVGAAVGAAIAFELAAPQMWFHFHAGRYPAPPPPPPVYAAPCCYQPPMPPPPVMVAAPMPPPGRPVQLGLAVSGLIQSPTTGQLSVGGVAGALQFRTSSHSLFQLEVQSLAMRRDADSTRRNDLVGLVGGRLYAWNAALAPYLDLAGGLGRASVDSQGLEIRASQLVGRIGLGVELRLGPHLVLEGLVAHVRRTTLDQLQGAEASRPDLIGDSEQATEVRGGLAVRF